MKNVPFVSNSEDDMHCVNAVFRMVHQYFFGTDLSWEELDQLTKAIPGKGTWTFIGEMEFAKKGIKVINIEPLDYERLYHEGFDYLKLVVGEKTLNYYREKSNLSSVLKYIPDYLELVHHETKRASTTEIRKYLEQGGLVGAGINSSILNDIAGFSLHFVLIYDYDETGFILHDPGLPPIEARHVTYSEFERCFNFDGANGGITVFFQDRSD